MKRRDAKKSGARERAVSVRVPASSANLGAGFDCFGLALGVYLKVRAHVAAEEVDACRVKYSGEGSDSLPATADNLIYRSALRLAEREGFDLPPLDLDVSNQIPLGRGLGSSAAAIVAGVLIGAAFARRRVQADRLLACATEIEGHADNVGAALYGGWVIALSNALAGNSGAPTDSGVRVIRQRWPRAIKAVIVSPDAQVDTRASRQRFAAEVRREDAVFNLQRVALFGAALATARTELLWEAMRDRLHQPLRGALVPGLAEALDLPRRPGLVGIALSGSGPSVLALATGHHREIGQELATTFTRHGIQATVRILSAGVSGARVAGRLAV